METDERLLTIKDVMDRAGVSRATVYNWMRDRGLRAVKVGSRTRIPLSAWLDFVQSTPKQPDQVAA